MDLSKELVIRREQPADYATVEQVVRDAFWNVYTPACTEHYLLHIIRTHPAFVPELDMVALVGEKIVGCVVYMRSFILACNGTRYETLTLGPIAVLPEYQRQGVGRSLISQSREAARRMGFRAILLCGDPDYYLRRGFVPAETYGICNSEGLYMEGLHACELYEGALERPDCGIAAAVTVDEQENVNFPYLFARKREKRVYAEKKRFSFCCSLLTLDFLKRYDFHLLDPAKNWYDVTISHRSLKEGFTNYLFMNLTVLHRPHSSRPWKLLKYTKGLDKI